MIDLFIVVIVSEKTNHKIQEMIDILVMIEAQDILVMIEAQDIPKIIEIHVQVETILDLKNQKMINF